MTHHVRAEALSMVAGLRYDLRALTLRGPEDRSYIVPLAQVWAALPGRPGVRFFHVPHPDDQGQPSGLYAAQFEVSAGASYAGGIIIQSRLIIVSQGAIECNGQRLGPGQSLWLAPEQPTSWQCPAGCSGTVFYNLPAPA